MSTGCGGWSPNRRRRCRRPARRCRPPCRRPVAAIRRATHKTIAAVTDDLDKFRFNRARRADPRTDQRARRAPGGRARCARGAARGARNRGAAARADDAASRRGDVAGARRQRPARRTALAGSRSRPRPRRTGDDRRAGQRQAAGTLDLPRDTAADAVESAALALPQVSRCSTAMRRARSSSCRIGSSMSSPDRGWRHFARDCARSRCGVAAVGCGWTPLYADTETDAASQELRAIKVDPIPERIGQRLEMALRNSLNPTGEPTTRALSTEDQRWPSLSAISASSRKAWGPSANSTFSRPYRLSRSPKRQPLC